MVQKTSFWNRIHIFSKEIHLNIGNSFDTGSPFWHRERVLMQGTHTDTGDPFEYRKLTLTHDTAHDMGLWITAVKVKETSFCFGSNKTLPMTIIIYSSHSGLLADKLGSYVIPFQVAGGIIITGAFIPFMLLCYKRPECSMSIQRKEENEELQEYSFEGRNTLWISSHWMLLFNSCDISDISEALEKFTKHIIPKNILFILVQLNIDFHTNSYVWRQHHMMCTTKEPFLGKEPSTLLVSMSELSASLPGNQVAELNILSSREWPPGPERSMKQFLLSWGNINATSWLLSLFFTLSLTFVKYPNFSDFKVVYCLCRFWNSYTCTKWLTTIILNYT